LIGRWELSPRDWVRFVLCMGMQPKTMAEGVTHRLHSQLVRVP
jgi:hypothetical protein